MTHCYRHLPAEDRSAIMLMQVNHSIRAIACQLGVEQVGISGRTTPESEALIELLLQSTHQLDEPLSREQLCL